MQQVLTFAVLAAILSAIYAQQSISGSLSHNGFTASGMYGGSNNWGVGGSYSNNGHTFGGNYHSSGTVGANYGYTNGNHNFGANLNHGPGGTSVGASYSFRFDDDEKFDWNKLGNKIDKGIDLYNKYKEIRDIVRSDDDEIYEVAAPLPYWIKQQPAIWRANLPLKWEDDEKIDWGKLGGKIDKGIELYNKYKEIRDVLRSDDDEFLNWEKINLGCTVRCGVYWKCVYANFKDSSAQISCEKPSGCQCDKFADDDDEYIGVPYPGKWTSPTFPPRPSPTFPTRPVLFDDDESQMFPRVWLPTTTFPTRRVFFDDDEFRPYPGNPSFPGPWTPSPTFPTRPTTHWDDDEKVDFKKLGRKIKKGVELYKKGRDLYKKYKGALRPTGDAEDDMKSKIGNLIKKGARAYKKGSDLYKKYKDIRSQVGFDDDMDERKIRRLLEKADKEYKKGRKAFRQFRRVRRNLRQKKEKKAAEPVDEDEFRPYPSSTGSPSWVGRPFPRGFPPKYVSDDDSRFEAANLLKRGLDLYRQYKENDVEEAQG